MIFRFFCLLLFQQYPDIIWYQFLYNNDIYSHFWTFFPTKLFNIFGEGIVTGSSSSWVGSISPWISTTPSIAPLFAGVAHTTFCQRDSSNNAFALITVLPLRPLVLLRTPSSTNLCTIPAASFFNANSERFDGVCATTLRGDGGLAAGLQDAPMYYIAVASDSAEVMAAHAALFLFADQAQSLYQHYQAEIRNGIYGAKLIAELRAEVARLRAG